jgi:RNA polymerase sigma-70 factor (ECF subfamily)
MAVDVRLQVVTMLPRLRRFARSLAGDADQADELVQGTCERALRGIDGWQAGTRLDSWLYRIMQNLWIDEMRKRKTRGSEQPIDEAFDLPGEDGSRVVEGRLTASEVMRALGRLPDDQRAVISLICIEDLSYREAASILGIPVGTVMSRLARSRLAIGDMLGLTNPGTETQARA